MKNLSYFVRLCALSLTFVTSSITFAAGADVNEENTLIKDDIASAQVLTEMCPSLIGKNAKFDQNIKKMVSSSLSGYSDKSATFESLQKDTEYQSWWFCPHHRRRCLRIPLGILGQHSPAL